MKLDPHKFWNFVIVSAIYVILWQLIIWLVHYCSTRSKFETEPARFFMYIVIFVIAIVIFVLVNRHKCGCYNAKEYRSATVLIEE